LSAARIAGFSVPRSQVRNRKIYSFVTHMCCPRTACLKTSLFLRRHLKRLNLTGNQLTVVPRSLEEAGALEYLSLDANPIRVIDRENAFPNLTRLKELSLREMPNLMVIANNGLSGLTGLESLHVQNCGKLEKIVKKDRKYFD